MNINYLIAVNIIIFTVEFSKSSIYHLFIIYFSKEVKEMKT